jgi:hypothetical protein
MKSSQRYRGIKTIPVMFGGTQVQIDPNSIKKDDRDIHHGTTADGTQVHSAQSCTLGDSTIIWPGNDGAPPVSLKIAEFEVMATQWLEKRGFTVQKK